MFLSKYGVARHLYVPMVKRGVVDYAVGADWTPVAGDVKISKDGGAAANVTNLPAAIVMGNTAVWDFSLTATEMQAAQVVITVADSATKAVEDSWIALETYGNASAQHALDLGTTVDATILDAANGVEAGWTVRQALRIIAASVAAKLSGAATATVTVRSITDAKDRITATVDANGNRSAVTLDGS